LLPEKRLEYVSLIIRAMKHKRIGSDEVILIEGGIGETVA
jgi:hypothetical protein